MTAQVEQNEGREWQPALATAGRPLPLWYSLLLAGVLTVATGYGLLVEGAYPAPDGVRVTLPETLRGQDLVTLLATVALVWGQCGPGQGRWPATWCGWRSACTWPTPT